MHQVHQWVAAAASAVTSEAASAAASAVTSVVTSVDASSAGSNCVASSRHPSSYYSTVVVSKSAIDFEPFAFIAISDVVSHRSEPHR